MLQRKIGTTLASIGMVMIIFGISALPAFGAEPANAMLQPSARPAIDPLKHHSGASIAMGHITGTVIDQRTGAPAAGVTVSVGGDRVTTDANGNYDHWLPAGDYLVALELDSAQGVATQDAVMVSVQAGVPTLQHLGFRSPAPAASQPAPTATPVPRPAPTDVPVAAVAKPAEQAHTDAAAPKAAIDRAAPPKRMPRTGAANQMGWLALALGMLLVLCGGLAGFGPVLNGKSAAAVIRRHAANRRLLEALLSQPARDEFLAALFEVHDRKRG